MGVPEVSLPIRVRAVRPDDFAEVQAWAAEHRAELLSLRARYRSAIGEAEAAESAAEAADQGCPPSFAAAVEAMVAPAMTRLDEQLEAVKRESVRAVEVMVRACNAELAASGIDRTVEPDDEWEAVLRSGSLRRPRPASDLWRSVALNPPAPVVAGEDDPFARFWQGTEDRARRRIRRQLEGTAP